MTKTTTNNHFSALEILFGLIIVSALMWFGLLMALQEWFAP